MSVQQIRRAMRAKRAGCYLAEQLGIDEPFDEHTMWRLARRGDIPVLRIRRGVYFLTDALDRFVAEGGTRKAG
jgi:hypothetical protein